MLRVKKLSETAVLPVRGSVFAAGKNQEATSCPTPHRLPHHVYTSPFLYVGYDLASAVDIIVPAKGKAIVKTDLAIAIPENTYARIAPRSGLAVKHFIDVGAGVVDYDYRGNVGVVLFNHSDTDFSVHQSDRIAQLILEQIAMVPVEEVTDLPSTERGDGGFGSTGTESHTLQEDSANSCSKRIKLGKTCFTLLLCIMMNIEMQLLQVYY